MIGHKVLNIHRQIRKNVPVSCAVNLSNVEMSNDYRTMNSHKSLKTKFEQLPEIPVYILYSDMTGYIDQGEFPGVIQKSKRVWGSFISYFAISPQNSAIDLIFSRCHKSNHQNTEELTLKKACLFHHFFHDSKSHYCV